MATKEHVSRKPVTIDHLVAELHQFQAKDFDDTPDTICNFLRDFPVEPASLQPYLTWDRQHYTRNLIDKTPLYELIAVCWEIGQGSSIHNHRGQNCWMSVPMGRLLVQNYRVLSQDIECGKCQIESSDLVEMNPGAPMAVDRQEPVHKVFNPQKFQERAVSLHVYSRPFDSCVVYSDEQGTCGEIKLSYTTVFGKKA